MDAAPPAAPAAGIPSQDPAKAIPAWPKSAQAAVFFLLGVAVTLLAVHACRGLRWASRPTERERGAFVPYQIDLNRADRAQLLQVPGVGDSLAGRIEAYRRQHGPFESVNDLRHVNGIGPTTLERLRPWLHVPEGDIALPAESFGMMSPLLSNPASRSGGTDAEPHGRKPGGKKNAMLTGPINVNRATETELQRLPGIGPRRAQLIIGERVKRPFASIEELRRVPGIGPKTLEKLRPYITVGNGPLRIAISGPS
jgi:competence protein ComEA